MNVKSFYSFNETIRIVGRQPSVAYFGENVINELKDILEAEKQQGILNLSLPSYGMHAFLLGTIYGKRYERARRKNKKVKRVK